MGSSFTNIQVHVGDRDAIEIQAAIAGFFRRRLQDAGFAEIASTEEADWQHDRTVYFSWSEGRRWIEIFDSEIEFSDVDVVLGLTAALSGATQSYALGVRVADSDVLELYLCREGEKVDLYLNDPHHPEIASFSERRRRKDYLGKPELWRDLLVAGATPAALRAAWDTRPIFIEENLQPIATLLGGHEGWGWGSWQDVDGDWRRAQHDVERAGVPGLVRLAFRSTRTPAEPRAVDGLPKLIAASGVMGGDASVGDALEHLFVTVRNEGGPGTGLGVIVYGSAIEQELVDLPAVSINDLSHVNDPTPARVQEVSLSDGDFDGRPFRYARLPDFVIPPRRFIPAPNSDTPPYAAAWIGDTMNAEYGVRIMGTAAAVGEGDLWVGFVPLENQEAGRADWHFPLSITAQPRRPLRSDPRSGSAQLRALDRSSRLHVWIGLGTDRLTCAKVVGEAIEHWWEANAAPGKQRGEIVIVPAPNSRPVVHRVPSGRLLTYRKWPEWRDALATCEALSGRRDYAHLSSVAFSFDAMGLGFFPMTPDDAVVPYLTFSHDLQGLSDDDAQTIIGTLRAITDDAMMRAEGIQAFVTRWSWNVSYGSVYTPYEAACGIHGQVINGRVWGSRYLRGVSECLWLGPDLLGHLGDLAPLAAIATLTPVGDSQRVVLNETSSLDELEQDLAPILPGRADWEAANAQAMDRYRAE